jgi:hypothetical protein
MFTCQRFVRRNADNILDATGVEWTESRDGIEGLIFVLMMAGMVSGALVLFFTPAFGSDWWKAACVGLALMSSYRWARGMEIAGTPRQLLFHRDGSIAAPLGFAAYAAKHRSVTGHHDNIASIEARHMAFKGSSTPNTHGVVLYSRDGDIADVAMHLLPDDAHKVAVQMTLALTELREDLASGTTGQGRRQAQSTARGHSRPVVDVFID